MARIYPRLIALSAFVTPIVGIMAPKGLAATLIVTALLVGMAYVREERRWPPLRPVTVVLFLLLLGWSGLSALWGFSVSQSVATMTKLAALFVSGLVFGSIAADLPAGNQGGIRRALAIGYGLSIVLLASEELSGGFLTQAVRGLIGARPYNGSLAYLNMAACVCAVMVWPVVSMMEGRPGRYVRFGAVVVLGATAAMLVRLDSLAAQLALGVGLVVFLVALYRGRMAYRGLRAAVVALMLFAPAWPHLLPSAETVMREIPNLTYSVAHRIVIWKFAADRIAEKPLTGWGLDSSRGFQKRYARPFPGKFAAANRDQRIAASLAYFDSQILPLHPHNGFLQIWLELGAVGALTVLGFLLWVLTAMERRCASRHARAGNAALFASGLVIFLTAFSSWQSWWQGALWLIAGLALAVVQPRSQDGGKTVP